MTRSQRSRIWSGDSPSGQPMVQMSQSSPISDRIVEVVLPARIPPHSDSAPRCVRSTREEPHPSPRRRKERTFTDSIFPFPHILLNGATRFLVDVLEQQVVRLLGALPRRDKHVLDVRRVEDLALADDASPELADDRFAVRGQGDVGQSGLQVWGRAEVSTSRRELGRDGERLACWPERDHSVSPCRMTNTRGRRGFFAAAGDSLGVAILSRCLQAEKARARERESRGKQRQAVTECRRRVFFERLALAPVEVQVNLGKS